MVGEIAAQAGCPCTSSDTPEPDLPVTGVTNAQPPTPRWPYDGVTLRLGSPEP